MVAFRSAKGRDLSRSERRH